METVMCTKTAGQKKRRDSNRSPFCLRKTRVEKCISGIALNNKINQNMAQTISFKKVKVNHSGSCGDFQYVAGQPVRLPEDILDALGSDSYEVVEEPKKEESKKEPEKPELKNV